MIVFDRLWETMKEKEVTQYKLIKKYGISPAQITRLKKMKILIHIQSICCVSYWTVALKILWSTKKEDEKED